jgi:hypothetical protein
MFKFEVEVQAATKTEAAEKLQSAIVLMKKFNARELKRLAHVVQNEPIKVAFAKKALGL